MSVADIAARARTLTVRELLSLYESATPDEKRELHQALFVRLLYASERSADSFRPHLHQ